MACAGLVHVRSLPAPPPVAAGMFRAGIGGTIADSAFSLFTSLDGELQDDVVLRRQFAEIDLQQAFPAVDFPTMMTLQVFQIDNLIVAAIPGEMTTEMGRRVREACLASARLALPSVQKIAAVCLANQYMSYITTPEEYSQQHYEGGSNLY